LRYDLQEWLHLDESEIANVVAQKISTVAVYLNGTRRWFLSQNKNWANYASLTGKAQRELSQLLYDHGVYALIQPLMGYDLSERGYDYIKLAVDQGLAELAGKDYQDWYQEAGIKLTIYGNWSTILTEMGFLRVVDLLHDLIEKTSHNTKHSLLLGVFADDPLDHIVALAKNIEYGEDLLKAYYRQPVGSVDLVIGSGQPAIWDIPLLNINKASLYFMQAPTFCLNKEALRLILYDHLYQRINDDDLYDTLTAEDWRKFKILGIGQRSEKGWIAIT
jgi:hypothetical protein